MSEENPNQDQPPEPESSNAAEDEPTVEDTSTEEAPVAEVTEEKADREAKDDPNASNWHGRTPHGRDDSLVRRDWRGHPK